MSEVSYYMLLCSKCEASVVISVLGTRKPVICVWCKSQREQELQWVDDRGCCMLCTPDGCQGDYKCCNHD